MISARSSGSLVVALLVGLLGCASSGGGGEGGAGANGTAAVGSGAAAAVTSATDAASGDAAAVSSEVASAATPGAPSETPAPAPAESPAPAPAESPAPAPAETPAPAPAATEKPAPAPAETPAPPPAPVEKPAPLPPEGSLAGKGGLAEAVGGVLTEKLKKLGLPSDQVHLKKVANQTARSLDAKACAAAVARGMELTDAGDAAKLVADGEVRELSWLDDAGKTVRTTYMIGRIVDSQTHELLVIAVGEEDEELADGSGGTAPLAPAQLSKFVQKFRAKVEATTFAGAKDGHALVRVDAIGDATGGSMDPTIVVALLEAAGTDTGKLRFVVEPATEAALVLSGKVAKGAGTIEISAALADARSQQEVVAAKESWKGK
jgi:hypothetical protein